jgi:tetratricopeptide (TPR) repeat protein
MRTRRSASLIGATIFMLVLALPAAAGAHPVHGSQDPDSLHAAAIELQAGREGFLQAANLHQAEARLRPAADPSAVDCLITAGQLFHALNMRQEAQRALEQAADRALGMGDVERAARAYLDAAVVAQQAGRRSDGQRLASRARSLENSPQLTSSGRERIAMRIHRVLTEETGNDESAVRADSLHAAALEVQNDAAGFERAARMHVAESRLRVAGDPSGTECLIWAGHLFYAAGLPLEARRTIELAGNRALENGDIERAARAYLDAAIVAQRQGQGSEVRRLAEKAALLAESPLLSAPQRESINRRISRSPSGD